MKTLWGPPLLLLVKLGLYKGRTSTVKEIQQEQTIPGQHQGPLGIKTPEKDHLEEDPLEEHQEEIYQKEAHQ